MTVSQVDCSASHVHTQGKCEDGCQFLLNEPANMAGRKI